MVSVEIVPLPKGREERFLKVAQRVYENYVRLTNFPPQVWLVLSELHTNVGGYRLSVLRPNGEVIEDRLSPLSIDIPLEEGDRYLLVVECIANVVISQFLIMIRDTTEKTQIFRIVLDNVTPRMGLSMVFTALLELEIFLED